MQWVPHALEWVRTLLVGLRKSDMSTRPDRPTHAPVQAVQSSPEVWGAMLALARLRRAGHTPGPLYDHHDQGEAHPVVRAYVLPPEERQRALSAWQLMEVSR